MKKRQCQHIYELIFQILVQNKTHFLWKNRRFNFKNLQKLLKTSKFQQRITTSQDDNKTQIFEKKS